MNYRLFFIIFGLLAAQISYYVVFNISAPPDFTAIVFSIVILGLFIGFLYAGYKWARWVLLGVVVYDTVGATLMMLSFSNFWFLIPGVLYLVAGYNLIVFKVSAGGQREDGEPVAEVPGGFVMQEQVFKYPTLLKRYQSVFIDFFILFSVMIVTMVSIGDAPYRQTVMITLGGLFLFIYEPVLTVYSSTIGQRIMGIRVRNVRNPNERISLLQAYLRIMVKGLLGWLSFITIHFNPQHRAIHDMAGESVVVKV